VNHQQNQSNAQAVRSAEVVVTLVTTDTTALASADETAAFDELPLEEAMHRRANAMTNVLIDIMDRPVPMRFFGLNE
jgi:hypothetical protein